MQGHCLAVQQAVLTAWGVCRGQEGFLAHKEDLHKYTRHIEAQRKNKQTNNNNDDNNT